jgi:hypothetical protein
MGKTTIGNQLNFLLIWLSFQAGRDEDEGG